MKRKINNQKGKFQCKMVEVSLPEKVIKVFLKFYKSVFAQDYIYDADEKYKASQERIANEIENERAKANIDPNFLTLEDVNRIEWIKPIKDVIRTKLNSSKKISKKELKDLYEINEFSQSIREIARKEDHFYKYLEYDDEALMKWCKGDFISYRSYLRDLARLNDEPKKIKGRYYHVFHSFSKSFRQKVLRIHGMKLAEVFDIPAADLHTLAKTLESEPEIKYDQLIKFQEDVISDLRLKFGTKKNGKCSGKVKRAFKIYLNLQDENSYDHLFLKPLINSIDKYFENNYIGIQTYIRHHADIWLSSANKEFEIISDRMFHNLACLGIPAFSVHDAIYVPKIFVKYLKDRIKDMFYDSLNLRIDVNNKFFNL